MLRKTGEISGYIANIVVATCIVITMLFSEFVNSNAYAASPQNTDGNWSREMIGSEEKLWNDAALISVSEQEKTNTIINDEQTYKAEEEQMISDLIQADSETEASGSIENDLETQENSVPPAEETQDVALSEQIPESTEVYQESPVVIDSEQGIVMEVPDVESDFKAFMDYRCITLKDSLQYKMQNDGQAVSNDEGFRMYNDEYMVAVGSYYAKECGVRLHIVLESGREFNAIVGDLKADVDTDEKNQHRNGNIVEFIVDTEKISDLCRKMGDMSYAVEADLKGKIRSIEVLS